MAVTKEDVDAWFAANPNATSNQIATAVQGLGGLDANAGLSDMLAGRLGVNASEVQNYYNNFTAPTGALAQANAATTPSTVTQPLTVKDLYTQYAGREPDEEGERFWDEAFLKKGAGDTITADEIGSFQRSVAENVAKGVESKATGLNYNPYFTANPDVAAEYMRNAQGMTPDQFAATHYQKFGAKEGRAMPTDSVADALSALDRTAATGINTAFGLDGGVTSPTETGLLSGFDYIKSQNLDDASLRRILGDDVFNTYKSGLASYATNNINSFIADNSITLDEARAVRQFADRYGYDSQQLADITSKDKTLFDSITQGYDDTANRIIDSVLNSEGFSEQGKKIAGALALADKYGFTDEDFSKATGIPLAEVKSLLDPTRGFSQTYQDTFSKADVTGKDILGLLEKSKADQGISTVYGSNIDAQIAKINELNDKWKRYNVDGYQAENIYNQITQLNKAVGGKNWSGSWMGGGDNAAKETAALLIKRGVDSLSDLGVEKNYEKTDAKEEFYNGQRVFTAEDGRKYTVKTSYYGGDDVRTETEFLPPDAKTTPGYLQETYDGGDGAGSYSYTPKILTEAELKTFDPKTGKFDKDIGNKLIDKSTGKVIGTSADKNFVLDYYDTGNFFKGKDKYLGITMNDQGVPIPYQTTEKSGLVYSPVMPIMLSMLAPGVSNMISGALPGAGVAASGMAELGFTSAVAPTLTNQALTGAIMGGGQAALTGQDPIKGAFFGGIGAPITAGISSMLPANMDPALAKTITNAGTTIAKGVLQGQDFGDLVGQAVVGGATSYGLGQVGKEFGLTPAQTNLAASVAVPLLQGKDVNAADVFGALVQAAPKTSGSETGGITNRVVDEVTPQGDAGSNAYIAAINAGANEEEALAAANAVTGTNGAATTAGDASATGATGADANGVVVNKVADSVNNSVITKPVDDGEGNLAGAQADAAKRNTVTIGNAEANDLTEAAALAKVRDPSASNFTFGGKTYTMSASDDQLRAIATQNDISSARTFNDAFAIARDQLGANKTFTWNGKEYSTATAAERPDLTGKTTVAANTDQSSAETNRLTNQNASLVTGNAPNQSAAETARLNKLNSGLAAGATQANVDAAKAAINSVLGEGTASDLVTQGLSNIHQAVGQTLSFFGGTGSALGLAGPSNTLTQAGDAATRAGEGLQLESINQANSNVIGAVQKAEGFGNKVVAGAKAIFENPLSANMAAIELIQEALPIGVAAKIYGMAGKFAAIGADVGLNAIESGGAAFNERYNADIKAGLTPEQADSNATKAFWVASAVTAVTGGVTDTALVNKITKSLDDAAAKVATKPVSTGAVSGAKEAGSETAEVFATGVLTALALGEKPDIDKILTQSIVEGYVGGKTAGSIDSSNSALNAISGDVNTASGTSTNTGVATTDLGTVGATVPGADGVTGTDLGSIGSVVPGADLGGAESTVTVETAQQAMSDLGLNVSDDVAVSLATNIQNATSNSGINSDVTSGINNGEDASAVVSSAVTSSVEAGANIDSSVASSVSSAIAAGADANTAVTAAVEAATNAGNKVTIASDANTTTITNATTNTTTTVDNNTGVTTTVNSNTNVTNTVNANTNTTTTVNANTNTTTQTSINVNTNIQTTVVTNTNTNTQTTIKVNTDTGELIEEKETVIPDGWTPVVVETPVIPGGDGSSATATSTTTKSTPVEAAKLSVSGSGSTVGGGATGLPSTFDIDPAMLASRVTQGRIDPLARVREAQAELERDVMMNQIDPRLLSVMQQRMDPNQQSKQLEQDTGALAKLLRGDAPDPSQPASAASSEGKYYSYGSEDSIDDILGGKAANYAEGGYVEPLKASGGMVLPLLAKSGGALGKYSGREDFKGGKHVAGDGDGQSDDIPAWLADGEFVFPADVVSALGNGSTKAGTDKLYEMMHGIRDRARSKGSKDLPPPALKSPLDYLKSSKRSSK